MPITPFLHDEAFEQRDIDAMSKAFTDVCDALKIDGDATAREVIAIRIIELTRRGEHDPKELRDRVVAEANGGGEMTHTTPSFASPDQVDITAQLAKRPVRTPDYKAQKLAVGELARLSSERPNELLGRFVELARELCSADSAGISLYEADRQSAGLPVVQSFRSACAVQWRDDAPRSQPMWRLPRPASAHPDGSP